MKKKQQEKCEYTEKNHGTIVFYWPEVYFEESFFRSDPGNGEL